MQRGFEKPQVQWVKTLAECLRALARFDANTSLVVYNRGRLVELVVDDRRAVRIPCPTTLAGSGDHSLLRTTYLP